MVMGSATPRGEQRRGVTADTDAPAEYRPYRPEVPAAAGRPDPDQQEVHEEVGREMDANARLERPARPPTGMLASGRQVGGQSLEFRGGPGPVDSFAPLRELVLGQAPGAIVIAEQFRHALPVLVG